VNKPYYTIDFSASACIAEIRVNDVPVLHLELPGQASSVVPINFAIPATGNHTLSARILPLVGETAVSQHAKLEYKLKLFEITNGFDLKETILDYTFHDISPNQKLPVVQKVQQFKAEVPYSFTGWENGQDLNQIDDVHSRLLKAYDKLAAMIKAGDYPSFRKAIENREHIMTTSMYLSGTRATARVDNLIRDFESGFVMNPLAEDALTLYYGNGKMAALRRPNGDHALSAINEEKEEEMLLDLAFYIPKGKTEFEII
jgi:hypothetical protein